MYLAFVLDEASRAELLSKFQPKFKKVIAHHVTIVPPGQDAVARRVNMQLSGQEHDVEVISHYVGEHIEALGVLFDGGKTRPLGGFYHVTLSLEDPAKPKDSNTLVKPTPISHFKLAGTVKLLD